MDGSDAVPAAPPGAVAVFGDRLTLAERYVALLAGPGVERGAVGPHETDRLWCRHVLNSAVVTELVAAGSRVLDVGSGAGLPGIPVALARPDVAVTLLEPMARRVAFLEEVVADLDVPVTVHRGRAEQTDGIARDWDVVLARAVAPLGRLAGWCLPFLRPGGQLLALKGASAADEAVRDAQDVRRAAGEVVDIVQCGATVVDPPTTVVVVQRRGGSGASSGRRKDR